VIKIRVTLLKLLVEQFRVYLTEGRFLDLNWPVKLVLTDRFA